MDVFWAAPPVIRTLTLLTAVTSILAYGGIIDPYQIVYYQPRIFTTKVFPPEIWRFFTSFWLSGPQIGIILDPYLLYMYGSQLETDSPKFGRKGDFMMYIIFVEITILVLSGYVLGGMVFLPALILALVYTRCQENPNQQTQFFILTMQAKYVPYMMLLLTFVMAGPGQVKHQATGIIAAHAHDFFARIWPTYGRGRNWVEAATPDALRRAFGEEQERRTPNTRSYGTSFAGPGSGQGVGSSRSSTASSSTTGASPRVAGVGSTWTSRGQGRRLGGD